MAGESRVRIEIFQIRQQALVELPVHPRLHFALEEGSSRHDDVVVGVPGKELDLHHLVRLVDVVMHLDAGLLLEVADDRGADELRPVVDVQDFSEAAAGVVVAWDGGLEFPEQAASRDARYPSSDRVRKMLIEKRPRGSA